jgi:hypothetical protein
MSKPEREWKYTLKNENTFEHLKEKIYNDKKIRSVGILQWFINTKIKKEYERIRLEIFKEMDSYRHAWTYCRKVKIEDNSKTTEKEKNAENREETELTIDMSKVLTKPEFMTKDAFEIINDVKENLSELNNYPAVFKIRHFLNAPESDFEFILDELLPIDNYQYNQVSHIIEMEQKKEDIEFKLNKVIENSFVDIHEKDLIEHPSKSPDSNRYKNKNIAEKASKDSNSGVPSAQKVISYIENMLIGPVAILALQGFSTGAFKSDLKKYNQTHKKTTEKNYEIYANSKIKFTTTENGHETENTLRSSGELDSLYFIQKEGYSIKKVYYFVFPDSVNNPGEFNDKEKQLPSVYPTLEKFTKYFFHDIECEPLSIQYSPQNRKMINKTFGEIWNNITKVRTKEENKRELIIDLTSGQKYPGIMAAMYCMFNQKPFFYKQDRSDKLIKFPAVPVNWDNVKIDGYFTFFNILKKQNIKYSKYLSLPQDIKNLFNFVENEDTQNESELISLLTLKSIKKTYESARKMPFGYGKDLIKHIEKEENRKWQEFIINKISNKWSLQWIGDQIPETVEHSQRHSKRLMEFTHNLINIIGKETFLQGVPKELHDEFFFVLAVAMNVHDLGHTNNVWIFENSRKLFLDGLPGVVRDLHNELTIQMLDDTKRGKEFNLLEGIEDTIKETEKRKNIIKAIKLVCKYHRGYLKIEDKGGKDKEFAKIFKLDITPLEKVLDKEFIDDDWKKVTKTAAQWLRFIDGTDVQSDRALSEEYTKIRGQRTAMESFNIGSELMYSQSKVIKELKPTIDMQQSLKLLKKISGEIKNKTTKKSEIDKTGKALGKKGELIEKAVYKILTKILEEGTDTEYYTVPYEIKQLAKFAFKIRQFPHFKKHASVKMVYPRFYREKHPEDGKKEKLYITYILEKEDDALKQKLIEDVEDEFNTALISSISEKGIKHLEIEVQKQEGEN